jgi:hypothetical protein
MFVIVFLINVFNKEFIYINNNYLNKLTVTKKSSYSPLHKSFGKIAKQQALQIAKCCGMQLDGLSPFLDDVKKTS